MVRCLTPLGRSATGEPIMVHASPPRSLKGRALFLGTSLLVLCGVLADPFSLHRVNAQTKTQPEPKQIGSDVIIGGGVEQIAYINQQLEERWKENKITPSVRCSDYEFIRRASLDLIGRIAKPAEIKEFMNWPTEQ